jgi:hypothetical protein
MKASAFVFLTLVTFTPASISTANAVEQATCSRCEHPRTGTAFDIAEQYANGGKFGGVTSGETGTTLDVARDSLSILGSLDQIASTWLAPPIMAKGN